MKKSTLYVEFSYSVWQEYVVSQQGAKNVAVNRMKIKEVPEVPELPELPEAPPFLDQFSDMTEVHYILDVLDHQHQVQ